MIVVNVSCNLKRKVSIFGKYIRTAFCKLSSDVYRKVKQIECFKSKWKILAKYLSYHCMLHQSLLVQNDCGQKFAMVDLIPRKLWGFLFILLLASFHALSYFFFLYQSLSLSLCTVFDTISSVMDEVLSINLSANVYFFGDFNTLH